MTARQIEVEMKTSDKKYIVFKREEFYQMMGALALPSSGDEDCAPIAKAIIDAAEETMLPDAVVIRTKDPFAGPALHSYAAGINLYVNLSHVAGEMSANLREVAHYFNERAMEADATFDVKLPD